VVFNDRILAKESKLELLIVFIREKVRGMGGLNIYINNIRQKLFHFIKKMNKIQLFKLNYFK